MKCAICTYGSWAVGLSTVYASVMGILGRPLPSGTIAGVIYAILFVTALSFLYYQIVPCPRCEAKRRNHGSA
ncbi:hypothetical protein HY374_02215 [Candidatus Berkelbacteria bacterium]|nr:hypothetical protein [Candidatus Berkelbacteria bacterium]